VPVILMPMQDSAVDGFVSMELWDSKELLFSFAQPLFPLGKEDRSKLVHVYPSNTFLTNATLPVYRASSSVSSPSPLSTEPSLILETSPPSVLSPLKAPPLIPVDTAEHKGLEHYTITVPLSEFIITRANFVAPFNGIRNKDNSLDTNIPSSEEATPFLYSYATNLTLKIKELIVICSEIRTAELSNLNATENLRNESSSPPEVLISFRQYGLSYVQSQGVYYIIRGGVILVLTFALAPVKYWHTGRKLKSL